MTPGVFLGHVQRFRRRLVWVAFLRHASLACAAAVAVSALTDRLVLSRAPSWGWVAAAAGIGLAGAALAAVLRAPTPRATGTAVDRRLELSDRVAAAVQFADATDPVARLVVDSASKRLALAEPAQVFPLRAHPRAAVAWTATVCVLALAALSAPEGGDDPGAPAAGGLAAGAPSGRALAGRPSGRAGAGTVAAPAPDPSLVAGEPREPVDVATPDRSRVSEAPEVSGREPTDAGDTRRPSDASSGSSRDTGSSPGAQGQDGARGGSSPLGAARGSRPLGAAGPAAGDAGRGGAARQTGDAATSREAGGVRGGATGPARAAGTTRPAESGLDEARAADIRRTAEAALLRDEVPPHLRAYVRDYFASIRSSER